MTRFAVFTFVIAIIFCAIVSATLGFDPANSREESAEAKAISPPTTVKNVGHPSFVSPHAKPIALSRGRVFVANTPADTVDVIDAQSGTLVTRINVGIDPVSLAVRPDANEIWVSNHVSDSVSVIDNNPESETFLQVIATVQEFDSQTKSTRFDEPVGIAFANNNKAYVALSSENEIAVVDVPTRKVTKRLKITAQDPRAIAVRGDKLYVIPFESNNQTQLSGGSKAKIDGELVTFDAWDHSIANNNVLSLGHVVDLIKHPDVPDRDLFIFDTTTDELVEVVDTLGTLLYGMTVDSQGRVYLAQTDARNDANGRAGTKKQTLKELENRAFLNRITAVEFNDDRASAPRFIDLEPLPPAHPKKKDALATPFAIEVSDDDSTLVVSAAGSDKIFTVDTETGDILGRADVGAVPRGIALESTKAGKTTRAWVLNAVENSVSLVDLSKDKTLQLVETIPLQDPTHPTVKRGRIAFETASASTTGTFSCASCHPDGHTDQLLWVLKTPIVSGGDQIMPRSTMPIRGLRDTSPFHWDGIPGDPYGGNNSAKIHGSDDPNCNIDDPASATRHLIDGGIASTMSRVGDETLNDEGKAGALNAQERDDMAMFLLSVPYPPAQKRPYTNVVSSRATEGFKLFHLDGDLDPTKQKPNVCGNCHRMPFLVSTNTPGTGMDAPTWRGANDRFLILPQGRLNIIEFPFYRTVAERGQPEEEIWRFSWGGRPRFNPIWDMVLEGSTGFSGTFGRQVTLNRESAYAELTRDLWKALETSAAEGGIVLEMDGVVIDGEKSRPVSLQFVPESDGRTYRSKADDNVSYSREKLLSLAKSGKFVGTFTGRHGIDGDVDHPQPAIWTRGPIEQQRGRQEFPILTPENPRMTVSGRHIRDGANVIVDGRKAVGSVHREDDEKFRIELSKLPSAGIHLLQIQNRDGLFSNDFIFHVAVDAEEAAELKRQLDEPHIDTRAALAQAIAEDDLEKVKRLLDRGARINARQPGGGSTPLSSAVLYDRLEIARVLLERGAKVEATNQDGNTPLLVAAFFCRTEIVNLLLEHKASPLTKNNRGESALSVVSGDWDQGLSNLYSGLAQAVGVDVDLKFLEQERPKIAERLRQHAK